MISFPAGQKEQPSKPDYYSGSDYSAADYYWLQKPNLLPYLASLIWRKIKHLFSIHQMKSQKNITLSQIIFIGWQIDTFIYK